MKFTTLLLFILSCSTFNIKDYSQTIPQIQNCWKKRDIACIEKHFGVPQERKQDSIIYSQDGSPTLKIFLKDHKISSIYYWILDPKYANASAIRTLLRSDDWNVEKIPEKNPHVVNLAEANFSQKLESSFLTYELDSEKKTRIIYWGGNYKSMEF